MALVAICDLMAPKWTQKEERGSLAGILLLARVLRLLGRRVGIALVAPVALYFFLTDRMRRRASFDFRRRAKALGAPVGLGPWAGYRHFLTFGIAALDRLLAWRGDYDYTHVAGLDDPACVRFRDDPRGGLVLISHLGSFEVIRAIGQRNGVRSVVILAHNEHSAKFARALHGQAPESRLEVLEVTNIDVAVAMKISAAVEKGSWIVIGGDRLPPTGEARRISAPFMGATTDFPQGPYLLASALRCPVHAMFCLREGNGFRIHVEPIDDGEGLRTSPREREMAEACARYAAALEKHALASPYQWYNFYDFWNDQGAGGRRVAA